MEERSAQVVARCAAVGVDVGADRLHIVGLDSRADAVLTAVLDPSDEGALVDVLRSLPPGIAVAIDGPAGPSAAPFTTDLSVSPKFRSARGCEVELGRQRAIWVSFATGTAPLTGWMAAAERVHVLTQQHGHVPLETYPYAIFRALLGVRPPKKTGALGISARVAALRAAGLHEPTLAMWSHDGIDAAAAALVALLHSRGDAVEIRCDADGTAIWLPALHPSAGPTADTGRRATTTPAPS